MSFSLFTGILRGHAVETDSFNYLRRLRLSKHIVYSMSTRQSRSYKSRMRTGCRRECMAILGDVIKAFRLPATYKTPHASNASTLRPFSQLPTTPPPNMSENVQKTAVQVRTRLYELDVRYTDIMCQHSRSSQVLRARSLSSLRHLLNSIQTHTFHPRSCRWCSATSVSSTVSIPRF
jgi:hypothetical protein